ncbi:duf28 domain-containing protein [Rutstroemia sp. NJR-2017a BVV2]|nr:duf28 domain-containing protein [Rutstroemia sp. NJR-2017a BVV2]
MPPMSRSLRPFLPRAGSICPRCLQFSTTSIIASGHNRWSKIKHDKGAVDAKKTALRSVLAHEIAQASKLYGPDRTTNPRLVAVLNAAKKVPPIHIRKWSLTHGTAGFPKASMEAAIARGQGKSTSGAALQKVTIEFIMPPTIAMIIDAETDNSNRTLGDLRHLIKTHGGNVTPTSYLFKKKGCVVFEKDEKKLGVDDVMDEAIEAGAEDLELDDDGNIVVWTDPSMTTATAESLNKIFDIKVASSDIIWDANEDTKVPLETGDTVQKLVAFIDAARDNPNVQGVYANVAQGSVEDGEWEDLTDRLDA